MTDNNQQTTEISTVSSRFVSQIEKQFVAEMGTALSFTEYERTLAQHLFLKIDSSLKDLEAKRVKDNRQVSPYTWENINMRKLALDAVHRVNLGLDALIPNHIHTVPYFNSKEKKYDLDLQIGYVGKDYIRREASLDKPVNIVYELVYSNDKFKPIKKSFNNPIESYDFEITNPFDRGNVIGGFGYVMYEEPRKNFLVIVTENDFNKSKNSAPSKAFWDKHPIEMRYKTLVNRTTDKLRLDPRKVNSKSYAYVDQQEKEIAVQREINKKANSEYIDITPSEAEPQVQEEDQPPETSSGQQQMNFDSSAQKAGPGF